MKLSLTALHLHMPQRQMMGDVVNVDMPAILRAVVMQAGRQMPHRDWACCCVSCLARCRDHAFLDPNTSGVGEKNRSDMPAYIQECVCVCAQINV